ncbi:SDR family NAD(P)-dependent oxidoreductase [Saccharopolyspora mangrovi]|uniref:SDR family oxidoreductase n=1 Tax=Saccharopolyspora mangrovi TaxID=3082379 RepID=A0ABU6AGI5_9PSEU|nr:3-oxoacyl-ACP reductase FabG [Saccharopolyspora sp. S2-29]MEB3370546.1 SDR family oxidoreductase [Saccharopolyspora sp. S2-29]
MSKRISFVTGAGAGIGAAIAERLAEQGTHVILADLNHDAATRLAKSLADRGAAAEALQLDVGDAESIAQAFAWLGDTYGRCDILVNNAGIARTYPFVDYPDDHWLATLNINLTGAFRCGQHAARLMLDNEWGRIINIASTSGLRAGTGRAAYGTSKAALIGLTKQMAVELAPHGITVNAVAPGPIETPLSREVHTQAMREAYNSHVPAHRYGTPDEVAAAVGFLATDAAAYINGHVVPVDGGFTAAGMLSA